MLVAAQKTADVRLCVERAAEIFTSVFSDYTCENMESQRRRGRVSLPGKIFQKMQQSKICSIVTAVSLALKWRLWYDYDMQDDMAKGKGRFIQ